MKIRRISYRILWCRLSLFREIEYEPEYSRTFECEVLRASTTRIFTLWIPWLLKNR